MDEHDNYTLGGRSPKTTRATHRIFHIYYHYRWGYRECISELYHSLSVKSFSRHSYRCSKHLRIERIFYFTERGHLLRRGNGDPCPLWAQSSWVALWKPGISRSAV